MVSAQGTRIVATGCTSGLGVSAIRHILQTSPSTLPPPYHIILLGRTTSPSSPAVRTRDELSAIAAAIDVSGSGSTESSVDLVSCDLSSLTSVDEAAKDILRKIKSPPQPPAAGGRAWKEISPDRIDVLLLNAAVAKTTRTLVRAPAPTTNDADGVDSLKDEQDQYEEMALVNHVAQQYLTAQLLPHMLHGADQRTPRVVFTGSFLHRQLTDIGHLDVFFNNSSHSADNTATQQRESVPWTLIKAYGASKFLQVLGVQHLVRLLRQKFSDENATQRKPKVDIVIVEPGFIPGTGLNRESSLPVRLLMSYIFPYLPLPFVETLKQGADNIADAVSRPLDSFEWSKSDTFGDPSSTTWDGHTVKDGVRTLMLAKRGAKAIPDERTQDEQLGQKWWPSVVQKQWERI